MIPYIIAYFVLINLLGLVMMGIDKKRARMKKWRIQEKTLFLIAFLGGSIGSYIGMRFFRHKTKHKSFVFGIPAIAMIQVIILLYIYG